MPYDPCFGSCPVCKLNDIVVTILYGSDDSVESLFPPKVEEIPEDQTPQ